MAMPAWSMCRWNWSKRCRCNCTRYHGCGLGQHLDDAQTLAVIAARLNSLAYGFSGVRHVLLERLADLINHRVLPRIPSEGSVGASGDLTPLSYVAAALVGERDVLFDGQLARCARRVGRTRPRAAHARAEGRPRADERHGRDDRPRLSRVCARADHLTRLAARLTALATVALDGRAAHFDATLFDGEAARRPGRSRRMDSRRSRRPRRYAGPSVCRTAIRSAARRT